MQTAIKRFIVPPKAKSVGLYQELLRGISNYEQLGDKLIELSERARALRQFDTLSEYASVLSNLPVEKFQTIGQYYLALSLCRIGRGELSKAQTILEKVASVAPLSYRAEAMISLSSISWIAKQPDETLRYCLEASKVCKFSVTTIKALRGIAVLKSFEGYHRSALRDLENLYPLIKYTPPHIYLDYLNSLAVELAECGRVEEARKITKITCSSPFIVVYPEWLETANELRGANRSFVAIHPSINVPHNVLVMPIIERESSAESTAPARILNMQSWKKRMGKKKNGAKQKPAEVLDERDRFLRIMEIYGSDKTTDEQRYKIWEAVEKIASEPDKPANPNDNGGA